MTHAILLRLDLARPGRLEKGILKSPTMLVCAAIFGGPLPYLLRSFLQNDSLMDIGQRAELYVVILRLVQSLGKCNFGLDKLHVSGFTETQVPLLALSQEAR